MFIAVPNREQTGLYFEKIARLLLCFLLVGILSSISISIFFLFDQIIHVLLSQLSREPEPHGLQPILISILGVLAMIEVYRTAMAYFIEGRVKVTYIIDTVLVALLTEVLAFWYRDVEVSRVAMLLALVVVLMLLRILAIRFSPNRRALCDGL